MPEATRSADPQAPGLRVCFVVAYFYPLESGAERQAREQGAELVRRGHSVHVVTRSVPGLPRDETVRGLSVHRWVRAADDGPAFAPSFVAGVVRALRRLRPEIDVVHTHQALWEAAATGAAKLLLPRLPTLVQPASSGYYGEADELARTRGRGLLRRLILRNDRFAAISTDIARQWRALGVPESKLVRTASGVDTERFRPGPSAWEQRLPPRPRVMFTGRLHPQKNLHVLIDAWSAVRPLAPAHLILAGEGSERPAIEARVRDAGLSDSVHLLGVVDDVADLLRAADIFVLPSVAEGMSNSLLEAMATALPCVASDIGGNQDLIETGQSGMLLPHDRPEAWAEALSRLLPNAAARRTLGDAAHQTVREHFALPRVVDRYVAIYRDLIAGHARRDR